MAFERSWAKRSFAAAALSAAWMQGGTPASKRSAAAEMRERAERRNFTIGQSDRWEEELNHKMGKERGSHVSGNAPKLPFERVALLAECMWCDLFQRRAELDEESVVVADVG